MKFNFMKSKIFVVLSILLFVEILFCITGCKDLLISQNAAKTSININLDLSKLIKTSRNQTSQEVTEYLLKIEAYNAENYQENAEVENLPLLTQAKSKVDVSGLVKVTLEVPIDSNVILVAKLHKIIDENTESEKPLYKGKSEIFKVKESDNKIHLVLTKTNSDLDIDISLNTQSTYKVEHYQQNIEDDSYTLVESDSENKTGTIGTDTVAVAKSYEGFSVNPFEQKPILADGSTTVKIYYTRNVYTVTFNANGGILSESNSQLIKFKGKSTEPTEPTKEGHLFQGWYTSEDYGATFNDTTYDFEKEITENITLHAKWWNSSSFIYVKGETIQDGIKGSGYTESKIFVDGNNVSIQSFYMSDHEVTQAEYKAIMGTWTDEGTTDVDYGVGDLYPAYSVSWFDTLVYCNERSMKENLTPCYTIKGSTNPNDWGAVPDSETHGNFTTWFNATCDFQANGYRLPTSAEWEYAARGGNGLSGFQYQYSGSDVIDEVAWYKSNSNNMTHEVKTKQPNELGLYDMSGNVWEWIWDISTDATNHRHTRGTGYDRDDQSIYISYHGQSLAYGMHSSIGFRLVRTATAQSQGDVYSQGISLNGKIYDKTSEVVVVPSGTVSQIAMTDDSSWNIYLEDDADLLIKGVFLNGRKVQLSPFAMSQFEVTQELYQTVIGSNPSRFQGSENLPVNGENQSLRPVECITWYDAVNFCNKLTELTMGLEHCVYTIEGIEMDSSMHITNATVSLDLLKKGYRLPTEAEWEFAARGGNPASDVWKYAYSGSKTLNEKSDFREAISDEGFNDYGWCKTNAEELTHEVGKKQPNTLGLYDMSGNVYEWCYDWQAVIEDGYDEFVINPIGSLTGNARILRGGGIYNNPYSTSVSDRHGGEPNKPGDNADLGFRIVRTITE